MEKNNKEQKAQPTTNSGDIIMGDKIDNRNGTIIKNIERYYNGKRHDIISPDDIEDAITVEEPSTPHLQAEAKPALTNEEEVVGELSCLERIILAIKAVHESGLAENNYHYLAVYQMILDKKILDVFSLADFEQLLRETGLFDEVTLPKANQLKAFTIKNKYPDWLVLGKKYYVTSDFIKIARLFYKTYMSLH